MDIWLSAHGCYHEAVIKRYVEFQEKVDKGKLKLQLDFGF